jgi:hypothetical protein
MTTKEQELVSKYSDQAFHGHTVRQILPICDCGRAFDEKGISDAPAVYFTDVEVFGKTYKLIEPVCPRCNRKIPAQFSIMN